MFKKILITGSIGMAVLAVALAAFVGYASAQTSTPESQLCPNFTGSLCGGQAQGVGGGWMMGGRYSSENYQGMGAGIMGRRGAQSAGQGSGILQPYMVAAFAETFDMTSEALQAELGAGKRMYEIALEKGYTTEQFTELMATVRATALEQAVADGAITQEQADWMLQRWQTRQAGSFAAGNCPIRTSPANP